MTILLYINTLYNINNMTIYYVNIYYYIYYIYYHYINSDFQMTSNFKSNTTQEFDMWQSLEINFLILFCRNDLPAPYKSSL